MGEHNNLKIVLILTAGFCLAGLFGYATQRIRLSPLLGYLIAGYLIGPFSPGYSADLQVSEQLAEIGVVLMLFGVGLHFKLEDLAKVKSIAIPGAIGQTFIATIVTTLFVQTIGWTVEAGIVLGVAVGVASTVVLVRVLSDNDLLGTPEGHVAVGWLIVEDVLTVLALLLLPSLSNTAIDLDVFYEDIAYSVIVALIKFGLLGLFMFTIGKWFVKYALFQVARTHSHELFTLTILALTFGIATGSALIFGTSIALGAFIAGMVIGRTDVHHQVLANAFPLRDAFVVIFFLAVGMLFNPAAVNNNFPLFIALLAVILVIKPLVAFVIVLAYRLPLKTALTVSIALAQIGEFSFIMVEEASRLKILPDDGYDVIIACAMASIALNPLLFRLVVSFSNRIENSVNGFFRGNKEQLLEFTPGAVVVGFHPIGQNAARTLEKIGFATVIIDRNIDNVAKLIEDNQAAIYGDATLPDILKSARVDTASVLVITVANPQTTRTIVHAARYMNADIRIVARSRYLSDQPSLDHPRSTVICGEEEEIRAFEETLLGLSEFGVGQLVTLEQT